MTALTTFREWLNRQASPRVVIAALFGAAIVLMVAAAGVDAYIPIPLAATILGAGAGIALFLSAYSACLVLVPEPTLARVDPKVRLHVSVRRPAVLAAAVVWMVLLLTIGRFLPQALGGTLNLAVLLALYVAWTPTSQEAEAIAVAHAQGNTDVDRADLDSPHNP